MIMADTNKLTALDIDILAHILSYLTLEDVTPTIFLSNSWY